METETQGIAIEEHPCLSQLREARDVALKWLETATLPKSDITRIREALVETVGEAENIQWLEPGDCLFEAGYALGSKTYKRCTGVLMAGEGMGIPSEQNCYYMEGCVMGSDHTFSVGAGYISSFLGGYIASRRDLDLWVETMLANIREELAHKLTSVTRDLQQLADFAVEISLLPDPAK